MSHADRIAAALSTVNLYKDDAQGLLRALLPERHRFTPLSETFRRGTLLWSISARLDALKGDDHELYAPNPSGIERDLVAALRAESISTASTVFRTWVSLVFMRFDRLASIVRSIDSTDPHLRSFIDLFLLDDVRHLRNAISHGSFEAEFGRFQWKDRNVSGELSYELLEQLNSAIFAFWLNLDAIAVAPQDASI